jgi:ABC-type thiamin/hydroxymethylpyrimidine transport system permease subunit
MDMNNPIVICVVLSIVFVAIFIVLFAINQTIKSGSRRHGNIQTIKKQPRCLKIFRTRF